jgi:hypothetical protein
VEIKELRMRPVTEPHDYAVKLKQAQAFLSKARLVSGPGGLWGMCDGPVSGVRHSVAGAD